MSNGIGLLLRIIYPRYTLIGYINLFSTSASFLFIIVAAIFLLQKKKYTEYYTIVILFTGFISFPVIWLTNKSCSFLYYLNIMAPAFGIASYKRRRMIIYGFLALILYIIIFYYKVAYESLFQCNVGYFIANHKKIDGGLAATYLFSLIVTSFSISNFEKINQELNDLTQKDFLTKAFNRLKLRKDLYELNFKFGVMLDIDYFKHVNDTYGHSAGDEVLQDVCNIIHNFESKDFRLYRYGGEEFFIGSTLDSKSFFLKLQSIYEVFENYLKIEKEKVTVSVGVAENIDLSSPDILVKNADVQLYLAKKSGRHQVYFNNERIIGKPLQDELSKNQTL